MDHIDYIGPKLCNIWDYYYFIIKLEYIQLLTTLIITYAIIFDKTNQINQMIIYSEHIYSNLSWLRPYGGGSPEKNC